VQSASQGWLSQPSNRLHVEDLRAKIAADSSGLIVFLGAGLSFGAARTRGRFDLEGDGFHDGGPFPSWDGLIARMLQELRGLADLDDRSEELSGFFENHSALDCAQLFKQMVGEANFTAFLQRQFSSPHAAPTPSHRALVKLPITELFTTNYDTLIESAFLEATTALTVSARPEQFIARLSAPPSRHLVKLHGSVDEPASIVLTRAQYAASRRERIAMFDYLRHRLQQHSFLFVGYSLSDPNFTQLHDDARLAMGAAMPASYLVQGPVNRVREAYLRSLDVNVVSLGSWNLLPAFLTALDPTEPLPDP
jgi:hypothetical protein